MPLLVADYLTLTIEAEQCWLEQLSLQEIIERYPNDGIALREKIFQKSRNAEGYDVCAGCQNPYRTREFLWIDHILPRAKGGLTTEENLQVLCCKCNMQKSGR